MRPSNIGLVAVLLLVACGCSRQRVTYDRSLHFGHVDGFAVCNLPDGRSVHEGVYVWWEGHEYQCVRQSTWDIAPEPLWYPVSRRELGVNARPAKGVR